MFISFFLSVLVLMYLYFTLYHNYFKVPTTAPYSNNHKILRKHTSNTLYFAPQVESTSKYNLHVLLYRCNKHRKSGTKRGWTTVWLHIFPVECVCICREKLDFTFYFFLSQRIQQQLTSIKHSIPNPNCTKYLTNDFWMPGSLKANTPISFYR